jgi:hypothetical protein
MVQQRSSKVREGTARPALFLHEIMLLIGICFFDAARFNENCFCAGFIAGDFVPSGAGVNRVFRFFLGSAEGHTRCSDRTGVRRSEFREKRACDGGGGAHPSGGPQATAFHSAHWGKSISEDVFVVGHGIHVVARFTGPRTGVGVRRGAGRCERRGAAPEAEVAEDFLDHGALVNTAITRMGWWQRGQISGSVCQTCRMRSRHVFKGSLTGGGGLLGGRKGAEAAPPVCAWWRWPHILLEYQP